MVWDWIRICINSHYSNKNLELFFFSIQLRNLSWNLHQINLTADCCTQDQGRPFYLHQLTLLFQPATSRASLSVILNPTRSPYSSELVPSYPSWNSCWFNLIRKQNFLSHLNHFHWIVYSKIPFILFLLDFIFWFVCK